LKLFSIKRGKSKEASADEAGYQRISGTESGRIELVKRGVGTGVLVKWKR